MPKYRKDSNRTIKQNMTFVIPHGGEDGETSSTVTRVQFTIGDDVNFMKQQLRATLAALGLNRTEQRQYIKVAFNNLEDI